MIGGLPTALEAGGRNIPINSDFRVVLRIFEALSDEELSNIEKAYVTVKLLYADEITRQNFEEAVKKAYWFCDGGDMPKTEPEKIKTLDWKHDEMIIFPAVNKCAGFEVRSCPYMHWWTFLGIFGEIGEGLFSTVMNIRQKNAKGKKLEKWEREFLTRNKDLVILRSAEEQAAIDETEEFLRTII